MDWDVRKDVGKEGDVLEMNLKVNFVFQLGQWTRNWKGKTNTGRSPKNCIKKKGEPPKNDKNDRTK